MNQPVRHWFLIPHEPCAAMADELTAQLERFVLTGIRVFVCPEGMQ
jgi:hypothetical protein